MAQWSTSNNRQSVLVLPVDAFGRQTSTTPQAIADRQKDARQTTGVFLQDEWQILGRLTANPGLRFDHANGPGGGGRWSPRFNLVWADDKGLALHGGYARYFVPTPESEVAVAPKDLAGTTGAPPTSISSPPRAETDNYFDLGAQQKLEHLTLGIDAYWRVSRNLVDEAVLGQTSLTQPFTYANGRARGVELSATYSQGHVSGWLNLAAARTQGRNINSTQALFSSAELTYASTHYVRTGQDQAVTASAGGSYKLGALVLSAQATYGSGLPRTVIYGAPDAGRMPAHTQVDLSAGYTFREPNGLPLQVRADLVNLFDARAQLLDGTGLSRGAPQWGVGRGILVGFEQSF